MEGDFIRLNKKLLPLSWLYGLGVGFRNMLFEMGILKSKSYSIPVISVGNLTVGGTGKTPHVEYLIRLLKDEFSVAVLSRGYMRKSHGFVMAGKDIKMTDIGDESFLIKTKFPDIVVAVDKKRTHGIEQLIDMDGKEEIETIILDDAFQHRYVKPGINILLVDYHRLIIYDELLPAGRLREPAKGKNRADIVIITKCPKDLKPMEYRVITKAMNLFPYQQLFFSTLEYDPLTPVFPKHAKKDVPKLSALSDKNILLLTAIASPKQLVYDLSPLVKHLQPITFSDHHQFTKRDITRINNEFGAMISPKLIITTEKDKVRLLQTEGLSDEVKKALFVLPMRITFIQEQQEAFDHAIRNYVMKHTRNIKKKSVQKAKEKNNSNQKPQIISFK